MAKFRKRGFEAYFNAIFCRYRCAARSKGRTFTLTKEEFCFLINLPCYYCGRPGMCITFSGQFNGIAYYTGLDRLDSARGYEPGNVVPACPMCNSFKNNLPVEAFLRWVEDLAENLPRLRRLHPAKPIEERHRRVFEPSLWTREAVMADAAQHETKKAWLLASPYAYKIAHKKGWFKEATAHMSKWSGFRQRFERSHGAA